MARIFQKHPLVGARGKCDKVGESADEAAPARVSGRERLYYLLILAVSAVGWIIFFFLWRDVLTQSVQMELKISLLRLGIFFLLIVCLTLLWIRHNLSRAAHGKRGRSSRLVLLDHQEDLFERPLQLPATEVLQKSRHIIVKADESQKSYRVADEEIIETRAV